MSTPDCYLLVYICIVIRDLIIKRDPINDLTLPFFFVPVPSQDLDFHWHMSWDLFLFNVLRWEVVVCFVDIAGIVNHPYLNFIVLIPGMILVRTKNN